MMCQRVVGTGSNSIRGLWKGFSAERLESVMKG